MKTSCPCLAVHRRELGILTISRNIAARRGSRRSSRKKRKEIEWSLRVAAILDAVVAAEERRHIHLFAMINLSTHGGTEAILELDADTQIRQGLSYFLRLDKEWSRKPWLYGVAGKVIRYRTPTSANTRAEGGNTIEWLIACGVGVHFAKPRRSQQGIDILFRFVRLFPPISGLRLRLVVCRSIHDAAF